MNIYDEAKVITHKEARKNVQECYGMVKTNMTKEQVWDYEHKNIETQIYITQQEVKEERAKKVEELLRLYREKDTLEKNPYKNIDTKEIKPYYEWACELKTLEDKIKALEGELK